MVRSKRQTARRGRQLSSRTTVAESRQESEKVSKSKLHSASAASSSGPVRERKHAANLALWDSLGYHKIFSSHGNRGPGIPARLPQKNEDYGELKEKYELRTNSPSKRVLLLQYPDRNSGELYTAERDQTPLEIRIKPKVGIVEVDIPLPTTANYDKARGIAFGSALRRDETLQHNGLHGLSGGLGLGAVRPAFRVNDTQQAEEIRTSSLDNLEASVNQGSVMDKFTLRGRIIPFREGDPIYMIATFDGC